MEKVNTLSSRLKHRFKEAGEAFRQDGVRSYLHVLSNRMRSDLYGMCRRLYARAKSKNGVVVLPIQGSLMSLRLDDPGLSRTLIRDGIREHEHTQLIHEEIQSGDVGVDLGANLGYYALMEAKLVGPRGRVIAVEPVPTNVAVLRQNVALNQYAHMEVHQAAIAAECGEAKMWITQQSNFCNLLSENDETIKQDIRRTHAGEEFAESIAVPTMTLDRFLEERGVTNINFIRMDIEGYEINATRGMAKTFRNATQVLKLFIEVHNNHFVDPCAIVAPWMRDMLKLGFRPKAFAVPGHSQGILRDLAVDSFPDLLCSFPKSCPHVLLVKNG